MNMNTLLIITVIWGVCYIIKALVETDRPTDDLERNNTNYLNEKCRNCGGYGHSELKCMRGYGIFDRMK